MTDRYSKNVARQEKLLRVLLVVQPSVSHYREPMLRRLMENESVHSILLGKYSTKSTRASHDKVHEAADDVLSSVIPITDRKIAGKFKWQSGVACSTLRENADIYVYEGNPYNVSTWVAIALARVKGGKVALWGHGWKRPDSGLKLRFRKFFYRLASAHLVYGDWAIEYAQNVGLDGNIFFPVYNSLFPHAAIDAVGASESSKPRARTPNEPLSLIFSGRLTPRHQVSDAIEAVVRLRQSGIPVELTIVGDGSELSRLRSLAADSGSSVRFVGAVYEFDQLAELYSKAHYAISPGASGLNVIQALGFGVPVIAGYGHRDSGPELEAIIDGATGTLFESGSIQSLIDVLQRAMDLPGDRYSSLATAGREIVSMRYTAERHGDAIADALLQIAKL